MQAAVQAVVLPSEMRYPTLSLPEVPCLDRAPATSGEGSIGCPSQSTKRMPSRQSRPFFFCCSTRMFPFWSTMCTLPPCTEIVPFGRRVSATEWSSSRWSPGRRRLASHLSSRRGRKPSGSVPTCCEMGPKVASLSSPCRQTMSPHWCIAGGQLSSTSRALDDSSMFGTSPARGFAICDSHSLISYSATGIGMGSSLERKQQNPDKCNTIGLVLLLKLMVNLPSGLSTALVPLW